MITKHKLKIAVDSTCLKIGFLGIGLCLHLESLNGSHSRFKFNVPVDTFEFHSLGLFSHNLTGHETIGIFKVLGGILKCDAIGFACCFLCDSEFGIFSILGQIQQDVELAQIGHAKQADKFRHWIGILSFYHHGTVLGHAKDSSGVGIAGDLDQVNTAQFVCVFNQV